ncbi:hypothetical protein IMSHALPRED_006863 [Imshaugia aleurites]|uniref:Uncharacterized protein n=1 Tax=Imshaugia aleurites TaxID=172621 RepID=A0A8H3FLS0_9LECA|nr:hypothetical protein IMSHALPRED_006863 [Imshaugia aleurites]
MDRVKNVAKGGWHPPVRSEHKHINQVAGWVGHGKDPNNSLKPTDHVARPLASLRDPDAFGPPPKNVNFHGGAEASEAVKPGPRAIGAPFTAEEIQQAEAKEQRAAQATPKPAPPPVPYRANTTGLSTAGLPKPPVRGLGSEESSATASPTAKPKPSLPPRLPPRQNSHPTTNAPSPPPDYTSATQQQQQQQQQPDPYLNQGALGRLSKAGVSVPGFGIGGGQGSSQASNPWRNASNSDPPSTSSPHMGQSPSISGLQSRFGKMTTSPTSPSATQPPAPSQGTSFAQKQAALQTAAQLRNDPSSITLSDARSSAATANNFRERHGEQVATGWKGANALNKKYDVTNRVNGIAGQNGGATPVREDGPITMQDNTGSPAVGGSMPASPWANEQSQSTFRKPPPPPPVRGTGTGSSGTAPPVPMGSKPRT